MGVYQERHIQNYIMAFHKNNQLSKKAAVAENIFRRIGITFNVYGNKDDQERLIPFDIIPRIILEEVEASERHCSTVAAINAFLAMCTISKK